MKKPVFGEPDGDVEHLPRKAAYAVIFGRHGNVCLVREASGLFLPGGRLETGESAIDAVHREVAEECGHHFELDAYIGEATQFFTTGDGTPYRMHASFFLGRLGAETGKPGEHELRWLPADEPSLPLFHDCHRWAVFQGLAQLGRS
jgi:8-oxo-dGTP diphosphatase